MICRVQPLNGKVSSVTQFEPEGKEEEKRVTEECREQAAEEGTNFILLPQIFSPSNQFFPFCQDTFNSYSFSFLPPSLSLPVAMDADVSGHNTSTVSPLAAPPQPVNTDRGQFFFAGVGNFPPESDATVESGLSSEATPSPHPPPPPVVPAMRFSKEAALR